MNCRPVLVLALLICSGCALAQEAETDQPAVEEGALDNLYRDLSGAMLPPPAVTVRDMQHLATAMQLRDYCMNPAIPNPVVRAQLTRFSAITGRVENCRSLLDY